MNLENHKIGRMVLFFLEQHPLRIAAILVLLVTSSLIEGVGLVTLLPVMDIAAGGEKGANDISARLIVQPLQAVGLQPTLGLLLLIIVLITVVKALLMLQSKQLVGNTVAQVAAKLRLDILDSMMAARWQYFSGLSTGSVANVMANETNRAASVFASSCDLLSSLIRIGIYGLLALFLSWQVTLAAVVFGALMFVLLNRFVVISRLAGKKHTKSGQELISRLTDFLTGIKPLKAMALENQLSPVLVRETRHLEQAVRRNVFSSAALASSQEVMITVFLAVIIFASVNLFDFSLPQLLFLALLFQRIVASLGGLQNIILKLGNKEASFLLVTDMIKHARDHEEHAGGALQAHLSKQIELRDVGLTLGAKTILQNVSLTIPSTTLSVLIGPSGAGKTTIIDVITGLHKADQGEVLIDGVPLDKIDTTKWRRHIGYVPQEAILFNDSIRANITLNDPSISDETVLEAMETAGLGEFIAAQQEGLERMVGERGSQLSGGQRQRVSIARALVRKPELLILDEATANLDDKTEAALCALIKQLSEQITVLAISHRSLLVEMADHVYHIEAGRLKSDPCTARIAD